MSLQVVNPATGEIAMQFPDADLAFAKSVCETLAAKEGQRWDIIQINVVFVCDRRQDQK
jgi:hypothetical protein